MFRRSPIIIYI